MKLSQLQDRKINSYHLLLKTKSRSYVEQKFFEIYLVEKGKKSKTTIFEGIQSAGRKHARIKGWVDGDYFPEVEFSDQKINLGKEKIEENFFQLLGKLIPPGGSLMVSYEMFYGKSKIHQETEKGLNRGFPPETTPLGYLLIKANCGLGMKNWYIPEGGFEGNPKLQGFKALNQEHRDKRRKEMKETLRKFLQESKGQGEIEKKARERAKKILKNLK